MNGSSGDAADRGVGDRLQAGLDAALAAGRTALRRFGDAALLVELKRDRSPVTVADREAETSLREALLTRFPHDGFLGEEFGAVAGRSGYEWVVDPIDGTKSFIRGVPLWATLVGCRRHGVGVLGVVVIPALDEVVYAARDGGAWHAVGGGSPTRARVSQCDTLRSSLACSSDFTSFVRRADPLAGASARAGVEEAFQIVRTWGDGYGYLLVATGRAEAMIDPLMNPWDAAAVEVVVAEAGGRFSDWSGHARIDGGDGVATNGRIHEAVVRLLG